MGGLSITKDLETTKNILSHARIIIYLLALIGAIAGVKSGKLPGARIKEQKETLDTTLKKKRLIHML